MLIDDAKDTEVMMMYNLIEFSDNYSNSSGSLKEYYWDDPNANLADSESFQLKTKITGSTPDDGNGNNVETAVPLKYLSNFWRTLDMPLINCDINIIPTWSSTCIITSLTGARAFGTTDPKFAL